MKTSHMKAGESILVQLVEAYADEGLARGKVIASVTQKKLGAALQECVSQEAVVNTDEQSVEALEAA